MNDYLKQLVILKAKLTNQSWLTINLPNFCADELETVISEVNQLKQNHHLIYFNVPHYQNIILHLPFVGILFCRKTLPIGGFPIETKIKI